MKYLVVIDMQNDFIDGKLGSREAQAIVPASKKVLDEARKDENTKIIFVKDTHSNDYFFTYEGQKYPSHCIKNTTGWKVPEGLYVDGDHTVEKGSYGFTKWDEEIVDPEEISIMGRCTDTCVIVNTMVLRTLFPSVKINLIANCCAGTSAEKHEAALKVAESCQIDVIYKYDMPKWMY